MTSEAETIRATALTLGIWDYQTVVRHASESLTDPEESRSLSIENCFAPDNLAAALSTIV